MIRQRTLIFSAIFIFLSKWAFSQEYPKISLFGLGKQFQSPSKDSISLIGLENRFRIEFSDSMDSLSYQLIGFDLKPQKTTMPTVQYTNLVGGEYTLKYKLRNEAEKTIKISITEAFWQKWWFFPMIAFYIILLIGIGLYFFTLYNFRQKMKMQLLRSKISADLHDEVGSNLSSIAIFTQVLKKNLHDPKLLPILDKITKNSEESVSLMQDTVWSLNPQNDSADKLINRIISYGNQTFSAKKIVFTQNIDIAFDKLKLNMEDSKNLFLILKEGINNIAKHAKANKVELAIIEKDREILFYLKDDGQGFDTALENEGNGLKNFKNRALESGFEININSEVNKGTNLEISISP